jgi:hypothetical protein
MTTKIRVTKITIESHEATIIRRRGKTLCVFCRHCHSSVMAFSFEETALRFHIPVDGVGDLARAGEIHFIETDGGNLPLICGGLPSGNK